MQKSLYQLKILVKNREINEYIEHDPTTGNVNNDHKTYVEGRSGSEFELKLINNSSSEVLMIPAVDGLSIFDGKKASEHSKGYIVAANNSVTIPGWTLDDNTVAKFIFADKKKSYAANHPDVPSEKNVGVIGVIVWDKKPGVDWQKILDDIEELKKKPHTYLPTPWIVPHPYPVYPGVHPYYDWFHDGTYRSAIGGTLGGPISINSLDGMLMNNISVGSTSNCMSNTSVEIPIQSTTQASSGILRSATPKVADESYELGTGFGKQTEFKVESQTFEKNEIVATLVLYYDSRKNLEKKGIIVIKPKKEIKQDPNPFPGMTGCKPPVSWKK